MVTSLLGYKPYDRQLVKREDTGLDSYVSDFADNLKKYANDILIGDFSLFKDLHKIVLERIKKSSY